MLQPDLGTAMTFTAIIGGAFLLAGLRRKTIAVFVLAAVVLGAAGWKVGLRDYQKRRLTTLVNPLQDPRGAGYQVIQSRITIGAGGLTGRGFMKGSQSQHFADLSIVEQLVRELRTRQIRILHTHRVRPDLVGRIAGRLAGVAVNSPPSTSRVNGTNGDGHSAGWFASFTGSRFP